MNIIEQLSFKTDGYQIVNITENIQGLVQRHKFKKGLVNLSILHTSASLTVQENASKDVLEDISTSINNDSAYIIPMNEQKSSFEYYSAILYGSTEITTKNGCKYLVPNVNNYNIFLPETEERWNKTYQTFNSEKLSELYLIGIELDGTQGQIRDTESYLINLGLNKVYEKNYDVGMLLIKYIK